MKTVTLTGRFDGEHIRLDEPFPLAAEARLLITIVPEPNDSTEQQAWYALAKRGLAQAYGDDEPYYPDSLVIDRPPSP